MYTYDTKVGFSQVDTDKLMKLEALTAVFQDVTCFQGEEIGVGFDYLEPRKQAWILNSWQIEVRRFPKFNEKGYVHVFGDGPRPSDDELIGENVYINILNSAKKYVYITTPYLIIDYTLLNAIKNAALRGVDVRIITPHIPDKKIIFNLTRSYYKELIEVGVRIFEYEPGFIHAKNFVSDDIIGVVGTINLDYRSLVHHFECAAWIYDSDVLLDVKDDFLNTQNECIEITKDFKLKPLVKLMNYILKFFTPLL